MSARTKKIIEIHFYASGTGKEPVREWLLDLHKEDRKRVGSDILTLQYEWPIGPPLVKPLGKKLWEVRSDLENRIARVVFLFDGEKIVLLHGFIKKTQKTPSQDLELAEKRAKEYQQTMRVKK